MFVTFHMFVEACCLLVIFELAKYLVVMYEYNNLCTVCTVTTAE